MADAPAPLTEKEQALLADLQTRKAAADAQAVAESRAAQRAALGGVQQLVDMFDLEKIKQTCEGLMNDPAIGYEIKNNITGVNSALVYNIQAIKTKIAALAE